MECRKWEESGLLYCAHELGASDVRDYEEHLKECGECRNELHFYRAECAKFFTPQILCESPSPAVDAEILRVCSNQKAPKIQAAGFGLFTVLFRRAALPAALFIVGFMSVGYVLLNIGNARHLQAVAAQGRNKTAGAVEQRVLAQKSADTTKDSIHAPGVNFARTRGNLDNNGVFPVDLKK